MKANPSLESPRVFLILRYSRRVGRGAAGGEEEMDTGADDGDQDAAEHPEEDAEEAPLSEDKDKDTSEESAEKDTPVDQGLQPQVSRRICLVLC